MKINKICCIGAGYVGGPTMAVIALKCPEIEIKVVDVNKKKINQWNSKNLDDLPVYEPGLTEIISKVRNKNLFFSTNIKKAIYDSEMIFVAVNTPTKTYGKGKGMAADLKYIELCAREIARSSKSNKIIIEKSTLPVRTAEAIQTILDSEGKGIVFEVLSNPEFLAEGTAIEDLYNGDRVLIGGQNTPNGKKAINSLVEIYRRWVPKEKIITSNVWSAELSKLVANAFLAQRISSINSISELCEKTGADVEEVAIAIGADSRIGSKFLKSSVGFGGSCFQKDILNLVYIAKSLGIDEVADYWNQVIRFNNHQKNRFSKKIVESLFGTVSNKKITFFGWAFKKNTNDTRESAAIYVADQLIEEGSIVSVYDPKVNRNQIISDMKNLNNRDESIIISHIVNYDDPYLSAKESHAIAILTEWDEFKTYNWEKIYDSMKKPAFVFDGRKILSKSKLEKIGFKVFEIGKA